MHPINTGQKYLNAKKEMLTQASKQLEKAIETDNVGGAIDALTSVAHVGLEVAPILKTASVLTKATTQLAASTAKKAATAVTSTLKAAETLPKAALPKAPKAPKAAALNTTASELNHSKSILNAYVPKTAAPILPAVGLAEERVLLNVNKLSAPTTAAIAEMPFTRVIEPAKTVSQSEFPITHTLFETPQAEVAVNTAPWGGNTDSVVLSLKENPFKVPDTAIPEHLLKIDPKITPDMAKAIAELSAQKAAPPQVVVNIPKIDIPHQPTKPLVFQFEESSNPLHCAKSDTIGINTGKTVSKVVPTARRKHIDPDYNDVYCYSDLNYNHKYSKHVPNKQGKAAWGKDVSINPISSPAEGQALLDTAYLQGETQAFNIRLVKDSPKERL